MTTKSTTMNTQNLSNSRNLLIAKTNSTIVKEKMLFEYERDVFTLKSNKNSQSILQFFNEVNILKTNAELSNQKKINWAHHYTSIVDETL